MAGIQYNGAIQVRPCAEINIPEPGVLTAIDQGEATYTNDGTFPQPVITGLAEATVQSLVENNVGGGDVVYATDPTSGAKYVFQIERFLPRTGTLILFDICSPPAGVIATFIFEIYRGNYNPTTGTALALGGPTGAGNSEGYSLYVNFDGGGVDVIVLTVNNDLIQLTLAPGSYNDLQVVKVLSIAGDGGPAPTPTVTALRVQQ